jgi:hypothetical protein
MAKNITIDRLSTISSKLTLYCNSNPIGHATGFIWVIANRIFLISNWHVFAGRNTYTGKPIHNSAAVPDQLYFQAAFEDNGKLEWLEIRISLFDRDGNSTWLQHPAQGQDIDIAAIEIIKTPANKNICALTEADTVSDMAVSVGSDVFIVGYPLGMTKQFNVPIWKRGSIASEFALPFDALPIFVVDTATREGMSGSPVYARSSGAHMTTTGEFALGTGPTSKFLGVYSGRYGTTDELAVQLGRVWHAELIAAIVAGNVKGSYLLRS